MIILILIILFLSLMILILIFQFQNNTLKKKHELQNVAIQSRFANYQNLINNRKINLKTYNFLKFNLSEALLIQKVLNLDTN